MGSFRVDIFIECCIMTYATNKPVLEDLQPRKTQIACLATGLMSWLIFKCSNCGHKVLIGIYNTLVANHI